MWLRGWAQRKQRSLLCAFQRVICFPYKPHQISRNLFVELTMGKEIRVSIVRIIAHSWQYLCKPISNQKTRINLYLEVYFKHQSLQTRDEQHQPSDSILIQKLAKSNHLPSPLFPFWHISLISIFKNIY